MILTLVCLKYPTAEALGEQKENTHDGLELIWYDFYIMLCSQTLSQQTKCETIFTRVCQSE